MLLDAFWVDVDNRVGLLVDFVVRKVPRWLTPQVQLLQGLVLQQSFVRHHERAASFVFALAVCEKRVVCFEFDWWKLLIVEHRH